MIFEKDFQNGKMSSVMNSFTNKYPFNWKKILNKTKQSFLVPRNCPRGIQQVQKHSFKKIY